MKKYILFSIVLFFALWFFSLATAEAATYYVATTGNDSNPGTQSQPWRTIQKGTDVLGAGDTLYIRGGTYNQTVYVGNSGTASALITISGYPGETAVIDGQDTLPTSEWGTLFNVDGNYVVVRNLIVKNSNWLGMVLGGRYDQAINVRSEGHMETGLLITGDYSIVDSCEVYYNAKSNEFGNQIRPGNTWASGLSAARHPYYATIRKCKVWNNWGEGLSTFEAEHITIEDNVVWDNWATNVYLSDTKYTVLQRNLIYWTPGNPCSGHGGVEGGIMLGDEKYNPSSSDNKIINNLVKGGNRCFYSWLGNRGGGLVNVLIAHNTFVNANSDAEASIKILEGTHINTRIENNIIVQDDSIPVINIEGTTSGLTFGYNLWSKTPPSYASKTGDIVGDPKLAKTGPTGAGQLTADYFKLLSNSPAINKAKVIAEVTKDFFKTARGSSPDIGAHEYDGSSDTQTPSVPANLTATAISSSQINLTWTASTDNVGVTGYRIYRGGTQIGTSAVNNYSNTGLSPSTSYSYTVAAYDAAGNVSGQSSSASATTLAAPTATTYYISTTGNDSNSGTLASPWKTIQKAANMMVAGDTVYIRAGTYKEQVVPARSGISGNYITYKNYNSEAVTINAAGHDSGIYINGRAYIQIIGLKIVGDRANAVGTYAGIWVVDNSNNIILDGIEATKNRFGIYLQGMTNPLSYVTVKNCLLHDNAIHGLWVAELAYDITIGPSNKIYNNQGEEEGAFGIECGTEYGGLFANGPRRVKIFDNEVYGNHMQGIRTWNAAYVWIHDNIIHDNGATGIQLEDGTANVVIENNTSYHNADIYEYETGAWVHSTKNTLVRNNILRNNKMGLLIAASDRVIAHNNTISYNNRGVPNLYNAMGLQVTDNSSNVAVTHNILYKNGASSSSFGGFVLCPYSGGVSGVLFKNNIISETTGPYDMWMNCNANFVSNYNDVYNTRALNIGWLGSTYNWFGYKSASGKDANSISANPLFVDAANGNFNLQSVSPSVNTGDFLTRTSSSGSGSVIKVSDVSYFTDGFGTGADGDLIKIGANSPIKIINVNYGTNTITVDSSISWNSGDGVSYSYSGSAPDMGAYEYTGSTPPSSDTALPSVPTNLTATAVSSSQINLAWSASTDNVGVTGYRIYRCTGAGCTPSTQITTVTTNSYSDTGLTANTTYVYRVSAYDAAGNVSGQSSSVSATTQVADQGPVGWWKLDETSGTTALDSSGNGNLGSLINGPVWIMGKIGNALSFDGMDDYVSVADSTSINVYGSQVTMVAWIYLHSVAGRNSWIVQKYVNNGGYMLHIDAASTLSFNIYNGSTAVWLNANTAATANRWIFLAGTYDSSGQIKIYVDGVLDNSGSSNGNIASSAGGNLLFGYESWMGSNDYKLDGLIDDVRIYNRAFSAAEIQALYNTGTLDTQAPLIPANLTAIAVSSSQINLSWTASTDNVRVIGYRIYRGGTQVGTSATNSYSNTGLSPSTTYTYTVAAYDTAGNASAQSSSASATTQAVPTLTLSVSLSANPKSGTVPLNGVDLTASVSGTVQGTINYTFYCNRSDTGTNITTGYAAKYDGQTVTSKTAVDVCSYSTAGTYTTKVIVERNGLNAESRVTVTVSNPPPVQCSKAASQETGTENRSLTNVWSKYATFMPSFSGNIQKILIKAGNWGGAWRALTCKVTNKAGSTDLSPALISESFRNNTAIAWRTISFSTNKVNLVSGTSYRIYCKGPDTWYSLYWVFDTAKNNGTYQVYMCPAAIAGIAATNTANVLLGDGELIKRLQEQLDSAKKMLESLMQQFEKSP